MSIIYTHVTSTEELQQILTLQKNNIPESIAKDEKEKEGFVTVRHNLAILEKMNEKEPHIIAKDGNKVIGYALSMVREFKNDIEVLQPMFSKIDAQLDDSTTYIVMGQVCIDKAYRKQGIFRGLYNTMRDEQSKRYDVLITEVDAQNTRSLHAHYAVGFADMLIYEEDDVNWHLMQWNWK